MNLTCRVKSEILERYVYCEGAAEGDRLPPIRELSKSLGASVPTICKAIEVLSAEGHLIKRRGSGVYLAGTAEMARFPSSKKLGIVVHSMTETLGHRVMEGVESFSRKRGYAVEIASSNYDCATEAQCIKSMIRERVQGIVLYPVAKRGPCDEPIHALCRDVPVIITDLYHENMKSSRVVFDNYTAAYEMTSWLHSVGRRNILFVSYNHDFRHPAVEERESGFRQALLDAGIPYDGSQMFECGFFLTEKDTNLKALLDHLDRMVEKNVGMDSVMCTTDHMAAAVIAHLQKKKIAVPDQICVTGFDNSYFNPGIHHFEDLSARWPTTDPDFKRMGVEAARLLIDQIEGGGADTLVEKVLPCPLLIPPAIEVSCMRKNVS